MKKKIRKIQIIFDVENDFESQIWALFDTSPLTQFSKFNNFLWVSWFLGKNISNFVPLVWKLHNTYCHNEKLRLRKLVKGLSQLSYQNIKGSCPKYAVCRHFIRRSNKDQNVLSKVLFVLQIRKGLQLKFII